MRRKRPRPVGSTPRAAAGAADGYDGPDAIITPNEDEMREALGVHPPGR
jgi:hypothetical protein